MKPYYTDDWLTLYGGDCREVLASLPADSVDCVVTSPPYWGLRDYGTEGQLGLERTPEEYVANMVAVFREVRRVLKPSGTCWLNLGDSYSGNLGSGQNNFQSSTLTGGKGKRDPLNRAGIQRAAGLAQKQLVGIPWRVAFALQADGWYLRSDIIWSKPNPMPESVTDRPTKAHEYLFLLTKSARYYFDADAVRESLADSTERIHSSERVVPTYGGRKTDALGGGHSGLVNGKDRLAKMQAAGGRNIRSVWTIATRPYPGAHFAVFPPELPERCIKAGSSEKGVCPECGAPWERVVERTPWKGQNGKCGCGATHGSWAYEPEPGLKRDRQGSARNGRTYCSQSSETGWRPTCAHEAPIMAGGMAPLVPSPAVILDPFGGSGTVGMVANRLSRRAILIDLNPKYLEQQMKRNAQTPLGLDAA